MIIANADLFFILQLTYHFWYVISQISFIYYMLISFLFDIIVKCTYNTQNNSRISCYDTYIREYKKIINKHLFILKFNLRHIGYRLFCIFRPEFALVLVVRSKYHYHYFLNNQLLSTHHQVVFHQYSPFLIT